MKRKLIDMTGMDGLNARTAAMLVQQAAKYSSRILIEQGSKVVNAKSLMGVLSLSNKSADNLYLVLDGDDEDTAFGAIEEMIRARFSASA